MRWFTSDLHFDHANVIRYCNRPFSSVQEMNEEMVRRWNQVVKPGDEVFVLGDVAMAHRAVTTYVPRLNGIKHLIAGNHDNVHPAHHKNKEIKKQNAYSIYQSAGFQTIQLDNSCFINGKQVLLSHFPYKRTEAGEHGAKYDAFRPDDDGLWLVHGHVHNRWQQSGRMINVGVDVWNFYPVSEDMIEEIIRYGERNVGDIFSDRDGFLPSDGHSSKENI